MKNQSIKIMQHCSYVGCFLIFHAKQLFQSDDMSTSYCSCQLLTIPRVPPVPKCIETNYEGAFLRVFLSVKWSLRNLKVQAPNLTQALIFLQIYFQPTTMSPTYIPVESWELGRQQTLLKVVKIVKFKSTKADVIHPITFLATVENPKISISLGDGRFGKSQIDGKQVLVRTCKK